MAARLAPASFADPPGRGWAPSPPCPHVRRRRPPRWAIPPPAPMALRFGPGSPGEIWGDLNCGDPTERPPLFLCGGRSWSPAHPPPLRGWRVYPKGEPEPRHRLLDSRWPRSLIPRDGAGRLRLRDPMRGEGVPARGCGSSYDPLGWERSGARGETIFWLGRAQRGWGITAGTPGQNALRIRDAEGVSVVGRTSPDVLGTRTRLPLGRVSPALPGQDHPPVFRFS